MLLRLAYPHRARVAAAAAVLAFAACRRQAADLNSTFTIDTPPLSRRPSVVAVTVADAPGAEAVFTADMTHPGMRPLVAKASETAPGRYEARLAWTMSGDWVVFFAARWPDGRRHERRDPVRVP